MDERIIRSDRDTQKSRLYKAEDRALARMTFKGVDVSHQRAYQDRLDQIVFSKFFENNFPTLYRRFRVAAKFSTRKRGASAGYDYIVTGTNPYILQELFLLHELSHVIARRFYDSHVRFVYLEKVWDPKELPKEVNQYSPQVIHHYRVGHGPEFAEVYLALVREFMGGQAYLILRSEFIKSRINFHPPGSRLSNPWFSEVDGEEEDQP